MLGLQKCDRTKPDARLLAIPLVVLIPWKTWIPLTTSITVSLKHGMCVAWQGDRSCCRDVHWCTRVSSSLGAPQKGQQNGGMIFSVCCVHRACRAACSAWKDSGCRWRVHSMRLRLAVRRRVRFCSAQAKSKQIQRRDRIFTLVADTNSVTHSMQRKSRCCKLDGKVISDLEVLLREWVQNFSSFKDRDNTWLGRASLEGRSACIEEWWYVAGCSIFNWRGSQMMFLGRYGFS